MKRKRWFTWKCGHRRRRCGLGRPAASNRQPSRCRVFRPLTSEMFKNEVLKTKSFERNFKLWKVLDSFWNRPWENLFGCFKWKPWNLELVMRCCNKDHIIDWLLSLFETGKLTNLLPKVPFLITFEISVAIPSSEWLIFWADGNYYIYVGCEKPSCFNVSCFDKFSLST